MVEKYGPKFDIRLLNQTCMQKARLIYIVEDNAMFLLMLKTELERLFRGEQFIIKTFANGDECVNSMITNPDLVIVDHQLDSVKTDAMTGLETIDKIRSVSPHTDFIIVTNNEQTDLFLKSKQYDIYDYLTKSSHVIYKLDLSIRRWTNLIQKRNENQNNWIN